MAKEYTLATKEKQIVDALNDRYANAHRAIEHHKQQIAKLETDMAGYKSSVAHIGLLIANQQGLAEADEEVGFDETLTKIIVRKPAKDAETPKPQKP